MIDSVTVEKGKTMAEYIKKEVLITSIESIDWYSIHRGELTAGANSENALYKANDIYSAIDNIPAADVAPIRHGRWIIGTGENGLQKGYRKCSQCGEIVKYGYSLYGIHTFCNYCGCRMDGAVWTEPPKGE